ncbi:MAG: cobalamin-dependent protein [Anaerolineales bacterium]|jgi:trimethylamine corrinoid protein
MNGKFTILEQAIRSGDISGGIAEASRLAESGELVFSIFHEGIEPCLKDIGDKFGRLEVFLPELIEAADVVKAVQESLKSYLKAGEVAQTQKGRIVLCTIQGDIHDIGKNIVKAMLEVNGFEVQDLGVNVSPMDAIQAAKNFNADIIAISSLMLTSLPYVKDAIEMVKQNEGYRSRFKILVGGGPVSRDWAEKAQADGYGDDAIEAVTQATHLIAN